MAATATAQKWNDQWWGKRKKSIPISKATNLPLKKHRSVEQKVRILDQVATARAGGETLASVCQRLNVSRKSIHYWRRRFELTRTSDGVLYYRKISPTPQ